MKTEPLAEKFSKKFLEVTVVENLETALEPEGTRKKLKRELRAEAMTRLEEAARTEADFENVISCWDKLDANRERKERYHEPIRGDMTLENGLKYNGRIFPEWMCSANYTSVRQGRYLDVVFNCPHELGEITGHPVLSKTFLKLDSLQRAMAKISAALHVKQATKERTGSNVASAGRGLDIPLAPPVMLLRSKNFFRNSLCFATSPTPEQPDFASGQILIFSAWRAKIRLFC